MTSFDNLGNLTFQPNPHYSGPVKPTIKYIKEVAYTTTQAEENDLQAGKIDLGFVDPGVLTSPAPAPGKVGPNWGNLAAKYNLATGIIWGFNYMPFNFSSGDPKVELREPAVHPSGAAGVDRPDRRRKERLQGLRLPVLRTAPGDRPGESVGKVPPTRIRST